MSPTPMDAICSQAAGALRAALSRVGRDTPQWFAEKALRDACGFILDSARRIARGSDRLAQSRMVQSVALVSYCDYGAGYSDYIDDGLEDLTQPSQ